MCTGNYSAASNNMKLVHWPLMGGLLHLVERGGDWAGPQPAQARPRCVPITVLMYNGPLYCVFNVPVKGLRLQTISRRQAVVVIHVFYTLTASKCCDNAKVKVMLSRCNAVILFHSPLY